MILVVDNYDSFTYNLVQYLGELGEETKVVRNDAASVEELRKMTPSAVIISPGPCTPAEAGSSVEIIKAFAKDVPILGVCLGHQCIGSAYGATIVRAPEIVHGKTWKIDHSGRGIFLGIPSPFVATRYHSLIVEKDSIPNEIEITAWTEEGVIMGIQHRQFRTFGVQFHPESFATEHGKQLLKNFLAMRG
jgi:anthranilate synthase/aminodeoxychorismate synthase-like glutamine amidotransferase